MKRVALTCALASAVAVVAFSAAPASAATGSPTLDLSGPKSPGLLDKVTATGALPGGVPGDQVTVTVQAYLFDIFNKQIAISRDEAWSSSPPQGFPATIYDPNQRQNNDQYGAVTGRSDPRSFRSSLRVSF